MICLKNRILKLITLINGISFLYFGSLFDSYSWIPGIICCINFAWLTLFAYANGYTYKSEKGEEMEEIKEQRKTVCEFLTGDKRTEYIADITEFLGYVMFQTNIRLTVTVQWNMRLVLLLLKLQQLHPFRNLKQNL